MGSILIVGTILFVGFVCGEVAKFANLPKVTGYIIAGIMLNPGICPFIPSSFPDHAELIANIALAFIVFSVGGTLLYSRIKKLGKMILSITFFEAEFAFLFVALAFIFLGRFFIHLEDASYLGVFVPMGLLVASLAAPTDPSATLAVIHEYKAKGDVSSSIMGVAAFDDILGIVNFSFSVMVATVLITHQTLSPEVLVLKPAGMIAGSLALGAGSGILFNFLTRLIPRETEGMLIVLIFALISLAYGFADLMNLDELLSVVTMGAVVVNFNDAHGKIFQMLERYTEEMVFVLFFTISGMNLDFLVILQNWVLILLFVLFRSAGKFTGVMTGAQIARAPAKIKKYVAGGLIPQGGIVVGLALLMKQNDLFSPFSHILLNIVIGATVIHELVGPVVAKASIFRAGEIKSSSGGSGKTKDG